MKGVIFMIDIEDLVFETRAEVEYLLDWIFKYGFISVWDYTIRYTLEPIEKTYKNFHIPAYTEDDIKNATVERIGYYGYSIRLNKGLS